MLQRVNSVYARWIHLHRNKMGHLWQGRYHSVALDEEHFWAVMIYVEQNPTRAGMVATPWEWRWSSARAHVGEAKEGLLDMVRWRANHTPETWKLRLELGLREAALEDRIREATLGGWPLGSDKFCQQVEQEFGVQAQPRTGRKPVTRELSHGVSISSKKKTAS
jgi:putative transposase